MSERIRKIKMNRSENRLRNLRKDFDRMNELKNKSTRDFLIDHFLMGLFLSSSSISFNSKKDGYFQEWVIDQGYEIIKINFYTSNRGEQYLKKEEGDTFLFFGITMQYSSVSNSIECDMIGFHDEYKNYHNISSIDFEMVINDIADYNGHLIRSEKNSNIEPNDNPLRNSMISLNVNNTSEAYLFRKENR